MQLDDVVLGNSDDHPIEPLGTCDRPSVQWRVRTEIARTGLVD